MIRAACLGFAVWLILAVTLYCVMPHTRITVIELYIVFVLIAAIFSRRLNQE